MEARAGTVTAAGPRWSLFACPRSGAPLGRAGEALVGDGRRYPIEGDIPQFLHRPPREDPEIEASFVRQLALAEQLGWREALARTTHEHLYQYVTDPSRLGVLDLFPARADAVVLEVGCGLGQMTCVLSPRVAFLHALEVVPGQARFAALRVKQERLDNVQVSCGGDDCRLPYRDGVFDAVLLNLVLEWCGGRDPDSHERLQERLLSELHRVLVPGGMLQLATKNRFALRYLLGRADEHCHDLPFGNALPRPLLRAALRLTRRPPADGWLHSHEALRRKLLAAGFSGTRSFWATPQIRYPTRFVPADDLTAIREARRDPELVQAESPRLDRIMRRVPARLVKHLAQGLLFQAVK